MPGPLELILTVLGGALVAEGLFYALFPAQARRLVELMSQIPNETLRITGLISLAAGVFLFWLIGGFT